jgi:hypothetical protein
MGAYGLAHISMTMQDIASLTHNKSSKDLAEVVSAKLALKPHVSWSQVKLAPFFCTNFSTIAIRALRLEAIALAFELLNLQLFSTLAMHHLVLVTCFPLSG